MLKQFYSKAVKKMMYGVPFTLDEVSIVKDFSIPCGEETFNDYWKVYHKNILLGKFDSQEKATSAANKKLFELYEKQKKAEAEKFFDLSNEEIEAELYGIGAEVWRYAG